MVEATYGDASLRSLDLATQHLNASDDLAGQKLGSRLILLTSRFDQVTDQVSVSASDSA